MLIAFIVIRLLMSFSLGKGESERQNAGPCFRDDTVEQWGERSFTDLGLGWWWWHDADPLAAILSVEAESERGHH